MQRSTADVYAALVDSRVCVKVGYGNWSPGEGGVQVRCRAQSLYIKRFILHPYAKGRP